ncbi:MAG: hypothetical protein JWP39_705, partial [Jatrophihabitans sp.]|nr:hypothetical protein [Jatrophihabitans sp.]
MLCATVTRPRGLRPRFRTGIGSRAVHLITSEVDFVLPLRSRIILPTRTHIIALVTVLCTLVVVLVLTFEDSTAAAASPLRHSQGQARGSAAKTKETARPTAKVQAHFYIGGLSLTVVLPDVPTAAPKPKPKATAAAHPQRKVGLPPRTKPGWVTDGHYLRSLHGTPRDLAAMRGLGARDATRNPAGQKHMVLLDIGGQARNGV